ncbi:efflux RND transporter permease subunit [Hymenobacter sp. PAMC 26628]|uniref:efflux RND transporter permease subunit n=1 Tax=Hymenobacter sp. PAMC 26628 TaxID=1484118 RepID=UPI0007705E26|nr:efflux RND transporter permease subunit [Hymenobacter sp. PAMC 26628]AMJ68299.1 copper transporter [Hymenobacter sp. PAMC 26628]
MQELEKEFKPTSWAIDNRTSIYIITVILTIAGLFTYVKLQKEKFPDIVVPRIIVSTIYPGISPADMENLVSRVIEKEIKSVNGVKKINSTSNQDYSIIDVEFNTNVKVEYAKQLIKDAVDKARTDLPNDLPTPPNVKEVSFSELPIMNVNLSGNLPLVKLKKYADDIQDQIESLPEITRVDIIGALEQQVNVDLDLYKMQAAHLSFEDVEGAIQRENLNVSGGSVTVGGQKRAVRVAGQYARAADIANIFVNNADNNPIRIGDIATVEDGFKDRESYASLAGKPAITLNVVKRSGENLISASDKIRALINQDQRTTLPKNLRVTITGDSSNDTRVTLNDLINTIIIGFILVTLILMFFMGTTNALFVGLSVPLSMFLAFLVLPILGFSLNMIVLFSFLLALGIVVDDAIVVIENTHRIHHDHPELTTEKSAKFAAGEVFVPVLAGTLTTVAPFVPLAFWPGLIGSFMYYLPITLIVTLLSSLIVAFFINPVFAVTFMQREDHGHADSKRPPLTPKFLGWMGALVAIAVIGYLVGSPFTGNLLLTLVFFIFLNRYVLNRGIAYFQTRMLPAFQNAYARLVAWAVHGSFWRQGSIMFGMLVLLVLSGVAVGVRKPKVEFFPSGDPKFIYTYLKMPVGTAVEVTDSVTRILEKRVYGVIGQNNPDVESVISNVAIGANDPQEQTGAAQSNLGKVAVAFKELSDRTGPKTRTYMTKIREVVKGIPGAEVTVDQESSGPPQQKEIAIEVSGDDYQQLAKLSKRVFHYVDSLQIPGVERLHSDLEDANPEIALRVDRERANREGISTAQVGTLARTAIFGRESSKFKTSDDDYDIQVRYADKYRKNVDALMDAPLTFRTNRGTLRQVPISAVADLQYGTTYGAIKRKGLKKIITISSNVLTSQGYTGAGVVPQISQALTRFRVPDGYTVKMGGAAEDQKETSDFLVVALVLAIGLIFMILVTQFNSLSKPLIILSEIIFSVIGVLFGYAFTGMTISIVMTGVGILALAGIVVKNGILLIEFTDILRSQGMALRPALIEAGRTRLNPVILTATAAILGLIPLAIGLNVNFYELFNSGHPHFFIGGESVVFWGPLAWTIIFGLSFATIVTLLVVPVMYLITESVKAKVKGTNPDSIASEAHAATREEVDAATPAVLA